MDKIPEEKTRERTLAELVLNVTAFFEIKCDYCHCIDARGDCSSFEDAANEFYKKGWRVVDTLRVCKECAKKLTTNK
jgi:hypothetical protein